MERREGGGFGLTPPPQQTIIRGIRVDRPAGLPTFKSDLPFGPQTEWMIGVRLRNELD